MSVELAMAASARDWPDRLHRHVLDHGGARVAGRLMGATQCVDTEFDVLLIDDVCSFLSPRLVGLLRGQGKAVVGVCDPGDGLDAKRRLLECGISDVIDSAAGADDLLVKALSAAADHLDSPANAESSDPGGRAIGVLGVTDGVGATEVAVAVATSLAQRAPVTLVDLDPAWPSVAQRLDLPPHPNLRSLVDVALHGGDIESAIHSRGPLRVIGGSAWQRSANPIPHHEITMVLETLAELPGILVADLGAEERAQGVVIKGFESLILVAAGDPIGLARLFKIRERFDGLVDRGQVLVAINKTPRRRFYRSEIAFEVRSTIGGLPSVLLPFDEGIAASVWEGKPASKGGFAHEVSRITALVLGTVGQ
ncbi:MAG: hypothetical protein WD269_07175 [Acidimicrobiia bacterium]